MDPLALAADIEAALVRALLGAWHHVNGNYFRHTLRPPVLQLVESRGFLGRWRREERAIELARAFVLDAPWGAVIEVLKHEVAHQFVHEAMGITDESAHGPAFRGVCERFGIDGRAAGIPAAGAGGPEADAARVLARIAKLLALGGSPNVHEAEAAMAAAQRLMLKHNLEAPARAGYGFRHLGAPTGRIEESQRLVAQLLEEHFFVECIWVPVWRAREGKRGTVLEVCGTPENLEMAGYVHDYLTRTAEQLWREYRRRMRLSNAERRTYLAGVMTGFKEKLAAGQREASREGLVWVRDADLHGFFRKRHPSIRTTRYTQSPRTGAHADGKAAGKALVLHRPVAGAAGGEGRLLKGRS